MNYRSIAQLSRLVDQHLGDIPRSVDLIVGIPRSGMLLANMIALKLNLPLTDLYSFVENRPVKGGSTRVSARAELGAPQSAAHALVIDDSVALGRSIAKAKEIVTAAGVTTRLTWCVAYVAPGVEHIVDLHFESVPFPRVFEWNVMHHPLLASFCVDIDGILCRDPLAHENDDGSEYIGFMSEVAPLLTPSYPIGHLVTSRLEKYRPQTERWLADAGIPYNKLHMLDCPDGETRRRLKLHGSFKAKVYAGLRDTLLFIESEPRQAEEICRLSGKPVLCLPEQRLYQPGLTYPHMRRRAGMLYWQLKRKLQSLARTAPQ